MMLLEIGIIFTLFSCKQTLSQDLIQDCKKCKILTDSFNHWLQKTSRGKFDGGDAAWEEEKLKSYSRSEVRLVEIQEGLCSDVSKNRDHCYTLADETEQILEKWWFQEDPVSTDLFTWLCIGQLKYCCPQSHYGLDCAPCPLDKNKNICGGHGKCNGEGTRGGSGKCNCDKGFTGEDCGECVKNYYEAGDTCLKCHKACNSCSGPGPTACYSCAHGWVLQAGECVDYDECTDSSVCRKNQFCVNKEGFYKCEDCDNSCKTCIGSGKENCSSCRAEHVLWSGLCVSEQMKQELYMDIFKKCALYCCLIIMLIYILRKSYTMAAIVAILMALYIFISQNYNLKIEVTSEDEAYEE